jgi:anti-sigma regulatory factor (Ser/Thr protein kinase)
MRTETTKAAAAITLNRDYPGTIDQAHHVRADLSRVAAGCPAADDLVLLASELVANAILHSKSGCPGHTFTIRAVLYPDHYAWVEIVDQGGEWGQADLGDESGRGLAIVAAIAGDGNWGIDGDSATRVAWFRLDWSGS